MRENVVQVYVDDFTLSSLKDMAAELHEGNMSRTVREIIKQALEEWDRRNG